MDQLDLQKYRVNLPGTEYIRQSLYDFQAYPGVGQTQLTFFQVPIGQSSKTKFDTNMQLAGQLPAGQRFLLKCIKIAFFPGSAVDTFIAVAAATPQQADDVYTFSKSGWLELFIGSKSYLTEAPLGRFPTDSGIELNNAIASNSATTSLVKSEYARLAGRPYLIDPAILLEPTQNFNVSLNWPTAVALPSTNAARVGVILEGYLIRNSQ